MTILENGVVRKMTQKEVDKLEKEKELNKPFDLIETQIEPSLEDRVSAIEDVILMSMLGGGEIV